MVIPFFQRTVIPSRSQNANLTVDPQTGGTCVSLPPFARAACYANAHCNNSFNPESCKAAIAEQIMAAGEAQLRACNNGGDTLENQSLCAAIRVCSEPQNLANRQECLRTIAGDIGLSIGGVDDPTPTDPTGGVNTGVSGMDAPKNSFTKYLPLLLLAAAAIGIIGYIVSSQNSPK